MEKKSSRCFSRFLCCSARTPSSPDAEHRTPGPLHAFITPEGPSSSNILPIQNDGQNCGSSSSLPINIAPPVPSPSSLPINKAPTVPSSSQSNASPFSHNNVMETPSSSLPTSSNVQTAATVSLLQANPSLTADVLEEISSQPSETVVAHPDEPHSVLPSTSSSRVTALPDLINNMREDAQTISDNHNLDAFIHDIFMLLEAIKESESQKSKKSEKKPIAKESQNKAEKATNKFLSITSAGLLKLKDLLLEGVNGICSLKDVLSAPEANEIARGVVNGLGQAHWATSCFLLVSYILDKVETVSSNREGCLSLLEHMYCLALDIKELPPDTNNLRLKNLTKDGTALIVEASLMCCSQIDRSYFSRFFSTTVNNAELVKFKENIKDFNLNMIRGMGVWTYNKLFCTLILPPRQREQAYPDHAVGIDEPFNNVTKLLQWESEERAVAVLVHGFGGIGKSTLADAVFARYYVKDCKYSVVRVKPDKSIEELQKIIIKDLMRPTEEGMRMSEGIEGDQTLGLDDYWDGQRKIADLLKDEAAFLYIDNVVHKDLLKDLLPTRQLKYAKKLRVLITARDRDVVSGCHMKIEVHAMQQLPADHGRTLLINEIYENGQITDSEAEKIANIVEQMGGIPKLLEMIGGFIQSEPDKSKAYRIVMDGSKTFTGNAFNDIEKYIFTYGLLPDEYKNPFLDICYFFKGWEWETVANIVGESALDVLEKRAFVSKHEDMISLHDVILAMGKVKAQDTRFDFTQATATEVQNFFEKDMQHLELVKGLWFSDQACNIPITKLNSMHNTLRVFGHKMQQEESFAKVEQGEGQCKALFHQLLVYKGESPQFPFEWSWLTELRFLSYRPQTLELLHQIPSSNLKHIELDGSLCSVREILDCDIEKLPALQVLRLIKFRKLEKLPGMWGESLRMNLKELTLSQCTAMKELAGSISQLTCLRILKLDNCYNLRRLNGSCESLSSSLQKLNMSNCVNLKWLPSSFGEALDSDSRRLFQHKGILSDSPQSDSDSDYESDED